MLKHMCKLPNNFINILGILLSKTFKIFNQVSFVNRYVKPLK